MAGAAKKQQMVARKSCLVDWARPGKVCESCQLWWWKREAKRLRAELARLKRGK